MPSPLQVSSRLLICCSQFRWPHPCTFGDTATWLSFLWGCCCAGLLAGCASCRCFYMPAGILECRPLGDECLHLPTMSESSVLPLSLVQ